MKQCGCFVGSCVCVRVCVCVILGMSFCVQRSLALPKERLTRSQIRTWNQYQSEYEIRSDHSGHATRAT